MIYPAQLEFFNLGDVYMTSCDVIFAIAQFPPRLLNSEKVDAGLISRQFYVNAIMSLENRCQGAKLR